MTQSTPCTILVVDDEPSLLSALERLLCHQGYTVVTARNGALAWEHLHAQHYDVILCDLLMPGINGQAFYILLQLYDPSLCARVIFLTGDQLGETTQAFLAQCGRPCLYKPCRAAEVLHAIEQVWCPVDAP